jgi:hypothetical protein
LALSTYKTQGARDPFGSEVTVSPGPTAGGSTRAAPAAAFKLMGILYNAASPSALVNDQLLELNKPVKMQTGQGEVQVRALSITRNLVVLEVGGQRVELRLGGSERDKGSQ